MASISANILVKNELKNIDHLINNLIDAQVDEIIFLDGGSTDGTWEKICGWNEREPRIIAIQWPQKVGSEYKPDFKEVVRRNLMIDASSSDYILYIDADERVSTNFKDALNGEFDCVAVSFTSFWDKAIRVNGPGDGVWSPDMKFRMFKNCGTIRFKSSDRNGLHNFLAWRGVKIPLGVTRGGYYVILSKLCRRLLGISAHIPATPPRIFHYHYYDLSRKKTNDLRGNEFGWRIARNIDLEDRTENAVVYVTDTVSDLEADLVTEKYWD